MLIQRQLPKMYVRGSIFNVTAKDLTPEQQIRAGKVMDQMYDELREDRSKFMYKLSQTIGADYKDMSETGPGSSDFSIAIWKATLHLLYHCDYTFHCKACKATSRISGTGNLKKIDQRHEFCPACDRTQITNPRQSGKRKGSFLKKENLLKLIDELADKGLEPPEYGSPIKSTAGQQKNENPEEILNDPEQRQKFYSRFIWNYLQQVIKENKIQKQFVERTVHGCSDIIALECIIAYLRKNEIVFDYRRNEMPRGGYHFIETDLLSLSPKYVPELAEVVHTLRSWRVDVDFVPDGIRVKDQGLDFEMVSAEIRTRDTVIIETSLAPRPGEKQQDKIEALEDQMNDLVDYERLESWQTVRESLTDQGQTVFDILSQSGQTYVDFADNYGDVKPRKADIAEYLGVSPKTVNEKMTEIRAHWLRLVPAGLTAE